MCACVRACVCVTLGANGLSVVSVFQNYLVICTCFLINACVASGHPNLKESNLGMPRVFSLLNAQTLGFSAESSI